MSTIPNELSMNFDTPADRRKLIELYKDSEQAFMGTNSENEDVMVSIAATGIVLTTYQKNGWIRINHFDDNGEHSEEIYEGRWDIDLSEGEEKALRREKEKLINQQYHITLCKDRV